MKTLKDEIVDFLQTEYQREYTRWIELLGHDRAIKKKAERFGDLAAKVESARCENCEEYNEMNGFCDRWHNQVCEVTPCMCFVQKEK